MFGSPSHHLRVDDAFLMAQDGDVLVDVRESFEHATGHAPSARLIPMGQLHAHLDSLPRDRRILLICATGNRSGRAARALVGAGFEALNVAGGMMAWQAAGLPVTR